MNKLKLIVVDDDAHFANLVGNIAEGVGMEVTTINDPKEFEHQYSSDIDIIVLDLFMPEIDGVELLRSLSNQKCTAGVILVSGKDINVLRSVHKLALEEKLNVLESFQKPFHLQEFENTLIQYTKKTPSRFSEPNDPPTVEELDQAIKNDELYLVYQPQINISDRTIVGFEALVRWRHPTKGIISPGYFIPMAEENNQISDITSVTTEIAIRQQGIWRKSGENFQVSINMSPLILDDLNIPEKLETLAKKSGADITKIMIEVTETALASNIAKYMEILTRLRMKGFKLSVDDFGTGYSSFLQLIKLPFTELKIDQTFIKHLDSDGQCKQITTTSILLAHNLDIKVVAEGIETEVVWNQLNELACDIGQGFWMGRPMEANAVNRWIEQWRAK